MNAFIAFLLVSGVWLLVIFVWVGFSHACDRLDDILNKLNDKP